MTVLPSELFKVVEKAIVAARTAAESAAESAMATLAVKANEPFATMTVDQRRLRNGLRAKARQLGGGSREQGYDLLRDEIAYQQWHRMLFARFLAENGLLMHPAHGIAVTLA
jgi:hypothetical protein